MGGMVVIQDIVDQGFRSNPKRTRKRATFSDRRKFCGLADSVSLLVGLASRPVTVLKPHAPRPDMPSSAPSARLALRDAARSPFSVILSAARRSHSNKKEQTRCAP